MMMSKTVDRNMFDTPLLRKLFELNDAMRDAYRACVEEGAAGAGNEHERRQEASQGIDEILECRPLASFKAEHLEFLELLIAYWRELEVESAGRPPLAPEPDPVQ
jgi:hypothetical protein